jgi:hypothetical protein
VYHATIPDSPEDEEEEERFLERSTAARRAVCDRVAAAARWKPPRMEDGVASDDCHDVAEIGRGCCF